jgi:hypothetical protein
VADDPAMQRVLTRIERFASTELTPRRTAVGVALLVAVAWIPGAFYQADVDAPGLWRFSLEGEKLVPAAISAFLLLAAGALAGLVAADEGRTRLRLAFAALAALFLFMAADEWLGLHESLEDSAGEDWQTLYLGIVVIAAVAWTYVLRELTGTRRWLWIAGAAAWAVAQGIERIQWDGEELAYEWTILPEELLEMVGTGLWIFALLLVWRGPLGARLGDHVDDQQHE